MPGLINVYIDSDRDGIINKSDFGQHNWVWGKDSPGAIVIPNIDRDGIRLTPEKADNELAKIVVDPVSSDKFPENISIYVSSSTSAAQRYSLYRLDDRGEVVFFMGRDPNSDEIRSGGLLPLNGETLYLEARELPGEGFEGLITFEFCLLQVENDTPYLYDIHLHNAYCVFRVAPWIMTPNTQSAVNVFTVKIKDENSRFLSELEAACSEAGVPLTIIDGSKYRDDRWIQDEIEFGYCESPTRNLPVVLDGPRDRDLDKFPEEHLLQNDFGHFVVKRRYLNNSLDSFGNLEVSPPVVVNGKQYPLGRIVFGGKQFNVYGTDLRQMMPELRRVLYAQKVQSPIEVYSDWLSVGHVDEFMNFIPDKDSEKGFRLMLASPTLCRSALTELQTQGFGQTKMFEGQKRLDFDTGSYSDASITIDEYLANQALAEVDDQCQKFIDLNKDILKTSLGLDDADIIYAPVTFKPASAISRRVLAFFPDMVNHLIVNDFHIVPKPYGPIINGQCVFEKLMTEVLPSYKKVRYIDDWLSYHEVSGEVHCGTNTLRKPFSNVRWWEHMPDGGFNI